MTRIITHFAIVLFCFFLFSLQTISQSAQMSSGCDQVPDNFNKSSSYQSNIETVLSTLRDRSAHGSYANATAGLSPNTVYGISSGYPKVSNQTLSGKINELIPRASFSSPIPYFVEDQEHVTQVESSYDLKAIFQCSPDLDPRNCTACLRLAAHFYMTTAA
ncbi:hypothetical protein HID58_054262 [Brassica napus]|uniref:Gnk2-homologous domain-containing protein n=1 Tax=Brassica napus TaxID=3708 RepID=A0ABQ8AHY9_BRANA|nr:hypothetical protein HID58_054262 [Brassica napus]